jgi:hypothetical protein
LVKEDLFKLKCLLTDPYSRDMLLLDAFPEERAHLTEHILALCRSLVSHVSSPRRGSGPGDGKKADSMTGLTFPSDLIIRQDARYRPWYRRLPSVDDLFRVQGIRALLTRRHPEPGRIESAHREYCQGRTVSPGER